MGCAGEMHPASTARTRRCTIGGSVGGEAGVLTRSMEGLAAAGAEPRTVMMDATHPEGSPHHIEFAGLKEDLGPLIGRTKGGTNTKLHSIADANGRSLSFSWAPPSQ